MRDSIAYGLTVWAFVVGFCLLCAGLNFLCVTRQDRKFEAELEEIAREERNNRSDKLWADTKDVRIFNNVEEFRNDFGSDR